MADGNNGTRRGGAGLGAIMGVGLVVVSGVGAVLAGSREDVATGCENMARLVANRNHSMLAGESLRPTRQHAYRVCVADPEAFRRLLR